MKRKAEGVSGKGEEEVEVREGGGKVGGKVKDRGKRV